MFDLRYHVASLTAVFLALVIGILVGVGIADRGSRPGEEEPARAAGCAAPDAARPGSKHSALSDREQHAAQLYVNETYPVLVRNRLRGKRIAVVFVGSADGKLRSPYRRTLTDAGAQQVRLRALKMPIDASTVDARLASQTDGSSYVGKAQLETLGQALGEELVAGGDTPLWDTLTDTLVEEQFGGGKEPVDGVVVAADGPAAAGGTSKFLLGLYKGLGSAGLPAVGVETTDAADSAVARLPARRALERRRRRHAGGPPRRSSLLLAGAPAGQYGLKPTARAVVPAVPGRRAPGWLNR